MILADFSEVERAMTEMGQAAGSSMDEMAIVEETLEYKLNSLSQTWMGVWQSLVDRGDIGDIIDMVTSLSETVGGLMETIGAIPSLVAALGAIKIFKDFDKIKKALTGLELSKKIKEFSDLGKAAKVFASIKPDSWKYTVLVYQDLQQALSGLNAEQSIAFVRYNASKLAARGLTAAELEELLMKQGVSAETAKTTAIELGFAEAEATATVSTTSLSGALKGLWISMSPILAASAPLLAIIAILGSAALAEHQLKKANEDLRESAKSLGEQYDQTTQDISGYKDEVIKLREDLASDKLSYDESREARERLIAIQEELADKYGKEAENINVLRNDVDKLSSSFDTLSNAQWSNGVDGILEQFNDTSEHPIRMWFAHLMNDVDTNMDLLVKQMQNGVKEINLGTISSDLINKINSSIKNGSVVRENVGDVLKINATDLNGVYSTLVDVLDLVDQEVNPKAFKSISEAAKDAKETLSQYDDLYDEYIFQNNILNGTQEITIGDEQYSMSNVYKKYADDYKAYNQAVIDGDEELAQEHLQNLNDVHKALKDSLDLSDADQKAVYDWFTNSFAPELQDLFNDLNFEAFINVAPKLGDGEGRSWAEIKDSIQHEFDTIEDLEIAVAQAQDTGIYSDIIQELREVAAEYDMDLDDIIDKIRDLDILVSETDIKFKDKIVEDMSKSETKGQIQDEIEELEIYLQDELAKAEAKEIDLDRVVFGNIDLNNRPLLEWTEENLEASKEALQSWEPNVPWEDIKKDKLGKVSTVLADSDTFRVNEGEIEVAFTTLLNTGTELIPLDKESVYSYIQQLLDELPKDWTTDDLLYLDEQGIGEIHGIIAEVGEEAKQVADTMHFNGVDGSIQGTRSELEKLKNQLESIADTNWADEAIKKQLRSSLDEFQNQGGNLSVISENLELFYQKLRERGDASVGVIKLVVQEIEELNKTPIEPKIDTEKIKNLQESIKSAYEAFTDLSSGGLSSSKLLDNILEISNAIKSMDDTFEIFKDGKFSIDELGNAIENVATKQVHDLIVNMGLAGTEFGDFLETTIIQAQRAAIDLQNLNTNIDGLQSAYSALTDAVDTYNQVGYITFDQLQALLTLEPQYLNCLFDENGQLQLNTQSLMALANQRLDDAEATILQQQAAQLEALAAAAESEANAEAGIASHNAAEDAHTFASEALDLAKSLGIATDAANAYSAALGHAYSAKVDTSEIEKIENQTKGLLNQVENMRSKLGSGLKNMLSGVSKATKGAGKAAKDAADKTKEAADEMKDLSSQLDEIQDAWKKLSDIQEAYAETGEITIDQAQELINMDYRYLAMLNMEGDAMSVNESAFETLAEAKLNEMKITLIRNAIDLVNTFANEATAAEYLANSYLNMGAAAQTATGQLMALQQAVMSISGMGATQAQAAGLVWQGTNNALAMLEHVNFNSGSGAGSSKESGSGADNSVKSGDEAAGEEESYEKEFDFIERLLERLNKLTEKWTDQAERFFSFWNKNWAVNREITANRKEIEGNQAAYSYYLKKANQVGLDKKHKEAVKNGSLLVETVTDKEFGDKIDKYTEWYEKLEACKEKMQELYDAERDLIFQKLDNILEYFSTISDYFDSLIGKLDSRISFKEAGGHTSNIRDLFEKYGAEYAQKRNAEEALWSFQTGVSREEGAYRSSEEIEAELEKATGTSYVNSSAFKEMLRQRDEILQGQEDYDAATKRLKEINKELAAAKKAKDWDTYQALTDEKNDKLEIQRKNKQYKTAKYKSILKSLDQTLSAYEDFLWNSDYYDLTEENIKTIKEKLAATGKITTKERKTLELAEKRLNTLDMLGDTGATRYFADTIARQAELQQKYDDYVKNSSALAEINKQLDNAKKKLAFTQKGTARRTELEKQIADLTAKQKDYKQAISGKNNWTKANDRMLTYLNMSVDAINKIREFGVVDEDISSNILYQDLLKQIGKLTSKDKANLSDTEAKNLAMYWSMLQEIHEGVAAENLKKFIDTYKKWWPEHLKEELGQKPNTTVLNTTRQTLDDLKNSYQDYVIGLNRELQEALLSEGKIAESEVDLKRNLENSIKEVNDSYDKQRDDIINAYMTGATKATYEKVVKDLATAKSNLQTVLNAVEKRGSKGATTSQSNRIDKLNKQIAQYEQELEAFITGATEENLVEYAKAWKNVYITHVDDWMKLTGSTRDKYYADKAALEKWDKEKQEQLQILEKERLDKIKELQLKYDTDQEELESDLYEKREALITIAREIAEKSVTDAQVLIDQLDALITRYQSIAELLSNTSFEAFKKYNVFELLGLDKDQSLTEMLTDQFSGAISASGMQIESLVKQAGLYNDLIEAAETAQTGEGFGKIFEEYREQFKDDEEILGYIDQMISDLNDNGYEVTSSWLGDWNQALSDVISKIIDTIDNVQELKNEFRENVILKSINETIKRVETLNNQLSAMSSVINDDWVLDSNGNFTMYGLAKANILGQQLTAIQNQTAAYADKVRKLREAQEDEMSAYATEEEFIEAVEQAMTDYYNSLASAEEIAYQIWQLGQQAAEAEVESVQNLISNYTELLRKKKELYEYDKNIKSQTKAVEELEAQIAALNGVRDCPFYFNCGKILRALTTKCT